MKIEKLFIKCGEWELHIYDDFVVCYNFTRDRVVHLSSCEPKIDTMKSSIEAMKSKW